MVSKQCLCVPTQLTSTVNLVALAHGGVAIISPTLSLFFNESSTRIEFYLDASLAQRRELIKSELEETVSSLVSYAFSSEEETPRRSKSKKCK